MIYVCEGGFCKCHTIEILTAVWFEKKLVLNKVSILMSGLQDPKSMARDSIVASGQLRRKCLAFFKKTSRTIASGSELLFACPPPHVAGSEVEMFVQTVACLEGSPIRFDDFLQETELLVL